MLPYLHLGSFQIGTFGPLLWVAGMVAAWVLHRSFQRAGVSADAVIVVATAVIAGVIGAKLWHILQDIPLLERELHRIFEPGWSHPWTVTREFFSWFSAGFAWFGGLFAGIFALMQQGRSAGTGAVRMLDLASPAAAIGYGVGRIGCLTSGDGDYGIVTKHWWGVHMRDDALSPPFPNPPGLKVEPTPVYELGIGLLLGWYLWRRGAKALPTGQLTGEYLVLSGIARFLIEFIRINPRLYGFMTNAQLAALLTVVAGAAMVVLARTRAAGQTNHAPVTAA